MLVEHHYVRAREMLIAGRKTMVVYIGNELKPSTH